MKPSLLICGALLVLLPMGCAGSRSHAADPAKDADATTYLDVEHVPVPAGLSGYHPDDKRVIGHGSGYTSIVCGKDGRVYIGTAFYGYYGYLLEMDPRQQARRFRAVASIKDIVREDLDYGINTQSKTHTKLVCDSQGRIWGGTKNGNEIFDTRPELGEAPDGFPGGHLYYYDPNTGQARDCGILKKQQGLMCGSYDPKRQILYYRTEPVEHLVAYHVETSEVSDKGRVDSHSRYSAVDKWGNAWVPGRRTLVKYDVNDDELRDLEVVSADNGEPYTEAYSCTIGGDGTKLYCSAISDGSKDGSGSLWEIDLKSEKDGTIKMRHACRLAPEGMRTTDVHTMGLAPDGRIYWTAPTRNPAMKNRYELHVMRYDPQRRRGEDVGVLRLKPMQGDQPDEQGRIKGWGDRGSKAPTAVGGIQGCHFDSAGNLYILIIGWPGYGCAIVPSTLLN